LPSYGPTEAGTNVIALTGVTSSTQGSNIGYPFGLNAIYVLDEHLRLTPLGCVGELFIGGPQVARGYLKNPEQTAKVFLDDPFRPGSTMYATGDLVRINPVDGSFTYLGRRDTQIKIRGLRVEIGEVEAVLKASSAVITNAVVIKVDVGRESLVAFLEYPSMARVKASRLSQTKRLARYSMHSGAAFNRNFPVIWYLQPM
jgi:Non-ribosomal peptide synthetase modules and related proteins